MSFIWSIIDLGEELIFVVCRSCQLTTTSISSEQRSWLLQRDPGSTAFVYELRLPRLPGDWSSKASSWRVQWGIWAHPASLCGISAHALLWLMAKAAKHPQWHKSTRNPKEVPWLAVVKLPSIFHVFLAISLIPDLGFPLQGFWLELGCCLANITGLDARDWKLQAIIDHN